MRPAILTLFSLFFSLALKGQSFSKSLVDFTQEHIPLKVYVSQDKPYYLPGDTIWANVFLVNGITHQALDFPQLVYVDWISPDKNIQATYNLRVEEGTAPLTIPTKGWDSIGNYTLRAYTQYQRNFAPEYLFQREINLMDLTSSEIKQDSLLASDYRVQFFPEGGDLIEGLVNKIAFKAQNELGQNINLSAFIEDENGTKIIEIKSLHEGMGLFSLPIKKGLKYTAVLNYKGKIKRFPLPIAKQEGIQLKVNAVKEDRIIVELQSSEHSLLKGAHLLGHVRGQVFYDNKLSENKKQQIILDKNKIPSGILHFTLFDVNNQAQAERLVFNENPAEAPIFDIEIKQNKLKPRSPIQGQLRLGYKGENLWGKGTISIFYQDLLSEEVNKMDIKSYLLLQSDLRGKIEHIHTYFQSKDLKSRTLLDLLLMTHGWRRFNWKQVQNKEWPEFSFPFEQSFNISGKVTKTGTKKAVEADLSLFILNDENFSSLSIRSDERGYFSFPNLNLSDTTEILIQANAYNERKSRKKKADELIRKGNKYVDIKQTFLNALDFDANYSIPFSSPLQDPIRSINTQEDLKQAAIIERDLWQLDIEEVVVTDKRINTGTQREAFAKKRYDELDLFYMSSTQKFLVDDPQFDQFKFRNIFDMIQTIVPRAKLIRDLGEPAIIFGRFSNYAKAVIMLDGNPVPAAFLEAMDPNNIALIDIIDKPGMYNDITQRNVTGASGPVIMLISKDPSKIKYPRPGVINITHPGYYQARSFYSPSYPSKALKNPDFRTTLHWNANLEFKGKSINFEAYTGDLKGNYLIFVEGITENGIPFVATKKIEVVP